MNRAIVTSILLASIYVVLDSGLAHGQLILYPYAVTNALSTGQCISVQGSPSLHVVVGEALCKLKMAEKTNAYYFQHWPPQTNIGAILITQRASDMKLSGNFAVTCTKGSILVEDIMGEIAEGFGSYLLEDENLLIFTKISHYEQIHLVALRGKAYSDGNKKPAKTLSIVPTWPMQNQHVFLGPDGNYLCVFEVRLLTLQFQFGRRMYDFQTAEFAKEVTNVVWIVDGRKTYMSSSNIVIDAVNNIDIGQ